MSLPIKSELQFFFNEKPLQAYYTKHTFPECNVYVVQVNDEETQQQYGDYFVYRHLHNSRDFAFPVGEDPNEIDGIAGQIASALANQEELW